MRKLAGLICVAMLVFAWSGCNKRWRAMEKQCLDDKDAPAGKRIAACKGVCSGGKRYPGKVKRGDEACKMVKTLTKRCIENNDKAVCEYLCDKEIDKKACLRKKLIESGTLKPK